MDNYRLLRDILLMEDENIVVDYLKEKNIWSNKLYWKPYGRDDNNMRQIANQQSEAEAALNEKIVNSMDAVLIRECLKRNIDPEGKDAPKTLKDAIELFNEDISKEDIQIYATGTGNEYPNIIISDYGEGQSPNNFESTLLSLNKKNKLRIPFVQGKFNMGSTGVLPFCGKYNIQIIISKRHPEIKTDDKDKNNWAFTITRKNTFDDNRRNSFIEYLVIDDKVPQISKDSLELLPDRRNNGSNYSIEMSHGTYIKMFNFKTKRRTTIITNMLYRLSQLLPTTAFEVTLAERREEYKTKPKDLCRILKGNKIRMQQGNNLYKEFPLSKIIKVDNQKLNIEIFCLRGPNSTSNLKAFKINEGIVYTLNGQYHGYETDAIFNRTGVNLDYINKKILVYVDTTFLDLSHRDDLFMASRDRLLDTKFRKDIVDLIVEEVKINQDLKIINEKEREEQIKDKTKNNMHITKSLTTVMKKVPNLSTLFDVGDDVYDKNKLEEDEKKKDKFIGLEIPTFFKIKQEFTIINPKDVETKKKFRIPFETNANNNIFNRSKNQAELILENDLNIENSYSISLKDGICSLLISMPDSIKVNTVISFKVLLDVGDKHFYNDFVIRIISPKVKNKSKNQNIKNDKKKNPRLQLPEMFDITKDKWEDYGFNEYSVLDICGNDFYINIDNIYVKDQTRKIKTNKDLIIEEYKSIFYMYGIAINRYNSEKEDENSKINIKAVSSSLAPMVFAAQYVIEDLRK